MSDYFTKETIKQKVYEIVNSKHEPEQAVIDLLEYQQRVPNELKSIARQPILYIFENQHDWENITKLFKGWKGIQKFERGFYERMKKRLDEEPDPNIPDHELKKQNAKLIFLHLSRYEKRKPIIQGIERYINNSKKIDPNATRKVENKTEINIEPNKVQSKKTELNKISEKKQEVIKFQKQKQIIGDQTDKPIIVQNNTRPNIRNLGGIRKPTLGMFRRQENPNSSSNPLPNKATKRLTFGMSEQLRNTFRPQNDIQPNIQKIQVTKPQQIQEMTHPQQNTNKNEGVKETQISEINKKVQILSKENGFQRKQQIPIRVNPIFVTQKKQILPEQIHEKRQAQQRSYSRSVTPNKPVIERKKLVLRKPTDYRANNNNNDDDDDFQQNKPPIQLFQNNQEGAKYMSERKVYAKSQEEELRRQIMNENKQPVQKKIQQNPQKQIKMVQQSMYASHKPQNKLQPKTSPLPGKLKPFHVQNQAAMIRREDQLYSDHEVSTMGFNPRNEDNDVDIYKLLNKLNLNQMEKETKKLQERVKMMKQRREAKQYKQ